MTRFFIMKDGLVVGEPIGYLYEKDAIRDLISITSELTPEGYEIKLREFDIVFKDEIDIEIPGTRFWVRCKTEKSENLLFGKGDERLAYTIDDGRNGIQYIVYLDKDGKGNAVSYQNKESFLNTFEIIGKR